MAKEVTPNMSDKEVLAVLNEIGAKDKDGLMAVMKSASPRQAFMLAIPWGIQSDPDAAASLAGVEGSVAWVIEGDGGGSFVLSFSGGKIKVEEKPGADATAVVTLDMATWKELASKETNAQAAFMAGKVQIAGDLSLLMQIQGALPMG
jgi:hypothetical protein